MLTDVRCCVLAVMEAFAYVVLQPLMSCKRRSSLFFWIGVGHLLIPHLHQLL